MTNNKDYDRVPVRVLGCLKSGEITVIIFPGNGFLDGGLITVIPVGMIPADLRMPNSEFNVLYDRISGDFVKVLPK